MFVVHFYENKNQILSQLCKQAPSVGETITLKGRKGKVISINSDDGKNMHVQVVLERANKNKLVVDQPKKKKNK